MVTNTTELYSTYEPEYIFSQMMSKLQDRDVTPTFNEKKWKITYEVYKELKEEEQYDELPRAGVRVAVKILKIDDKRVCVEFRRLQGCSWFFYEHFSEMKQSLQALNDAVLDETE